MIVRKEEFLALKQGSLSVSEYRDKFLKLSRYAPEDVNTDFLSNSSNSTVRARNLEETSTNIRTTRQLAFLPQHPTRMAKQLQRK
jgi:hypothetical protein